jgi:hypothetical protein
VKKKNYIKDFIDFIKGVIWLAIIFLLIFLFVFLFAFLEEKRGEIFLGVLIFLGPYLYDLFRKKAEPKWEMLGHLRGHLPFYYDIRSIKWITNDIGEIWTKVISLDENFPEKLMSFLTTQGISFQEVQKLHGLFYEVKFLYQIDIKNKKIKMVCMECGDNNGNFIYNIPFPENYSNWNSIPPESMGELLLKKMSEFKKTKKFLKLFRFKNISQNPQREF